MRRSNVRKAIGGGVATVFLTLTLSLSGCATTTQLPPPTPPGDDPRLVLFLVVDQARADYLVRFRPLFQHGLKRLLEESVVFTDAHHDHAYTTTAPGHATLATGLHPAHHGIVNNSWYDRQLQETIAAVYDLIDVESPRSLLAPTLGDRLKEKSPRSKVFGASFKDRSAIFSSGHHADGAFWYDSAEGLFMTSTYYDELPTWLDDFHDTAYLDRYFGTLWEPLPEVVSEAHKYDVEPLDRGLIDYQFPHPLGSTSLRPDSSFYSAVYVSPIADRYLAELAKALVVGENLGADGDVDILALGFSALDAVGHNFGPNSPEVMDTILNLDRTLGDLLDFIDQHIGLEHVVVTLSSDHGVGMVPELAATRGLGDGRFDTREIGCIQEAGLRLHQRFGDTAWVDRGFYLDHEVIAEQGIDPNELTAAIREAVEGCPGVARVWTRDELLATPEDPIGKIFAHGFHPERSADLIVQLDPNRLSSRSSEANHGSPYPYDTAVPWLLRLPSGRHREVSERVHTVDVAPTVARLIGLEPLAAFDGVDRAPLFE
jgi:predicted AlkP superfamily pyrophosphatase or phosphodiesterase